LSLQYALLNDLSILDSLLISVRKIDGSHLEIDNLCVESLLESLVQLVSHVSSNIRPLEEEVDSFVFSCNITDSINSSSED
jgi:hypothetical protein